MATRSLHRLSAKSIASKTLPGYYADGGGLYLQVSKWGTKSWVFRFMRAGRAREMGLGPLADVGMASARDEAHKARLLLREGKDPIDERRVRLAAHSAAAAVSKSFKECADAYIDAHRAGWKNEKHAAQWENTLEGLCIQAPRPPSGLVDRHGARSRGPSSNLDREKRDRATATRAH